MVGLDAGDLNFIRENIARLPNLARLFGETEPQPLQTTAGELPGSVWPTFYTGSLPGDHGIYHHLQWDPDANRMRRVSEEWLYCEPFWYEIARSGKRVCAVDVPMTFPSRLESGLEVINWGSHDQLGPFHANDKSTQRALQREFGLHPMGPEIPVEKTAEQLAKIQAALISGAAIKGELTRRLMAQEGWDLFVVVFGESHRGGHILWRDPDSHDPLLASDALLEVYVAVDTALGAIVDQMDLSCDSLVLFSLHGMQANQSQEHFVPKLMDRLNAGFRGEAIDTPEPQPKQSSLMRTLRELVPARLQHAIAHRVPVWVRDWVVSRAVDAGHKWESTPGIALLADLNGYLRFNVRGREVKGFLDDGGAQHEEYRSWLVSNLKSFQTKEGQSLVADVLEATQHYAGERTKYLPDLIVTWTGAAPTSQIHSSNLGTIRGDLATGRGGNHRAEGFVCSLGAGTTRIPQPTHIKDLAQFAGQLVYSRD